MESGSYEGYFHAVDLPKLLQHYTLHNSNILPWQVYTKKDFTLYKAQKASSKTGKKLHTSILISDKHNAKYKMHSLKLTNMLPNMVANMVVNTKTKLRSLKLLTTLPTTLLTTIPNTIHCFKALFQCQPYSNVHNLTLSNPIQMVNNHRIAGS